MTQSKIIASNFGKTLLFPDGYTCTSPHVDTLSTKNPQNIPHFYIFILLIFCVVLFWNFFSSADSFVVVAFLKLTFQTIKKNFKLIKNYNN
jgi:hypothetical protein